MNNDDITANRGVAIYWDFENLHAGVVDAKYGEGAYAKQENRYKPQEPLVDVQALVELAASFGPVAINRAYGNWQYFGRYRDSLLQSAVELIQLFPPGASAKNGADIKLCLDATEDIGRFWHIGTVVIIGGDSDFMPVSQKIKAAGRMLVGSHGRLHVHGRPRLPSFQFTAARRKDCTRTFGLSMRDELAVPDGFCWSAPLSLTRTRSASFRAGCADHGLTCRAINLLVA